MLIVIAVKRQDTVYFGVYLDEILIFKSCDFESVIKEIRKVSKERKRRNNAIKRKRVWWGIGMDDYPESLKDVSLAKGKNILEEIDRVSAC